MKSPNLLFRRTHLYLGMLLLPWLATYALSTVLFNHPDLFGGRTRPASQVWAPLWEKDYTLELPSGNEALRDAVRRALTENGITGPFGVQRQGERLTINVPNFRTPQRVTYDSGTKKLRAEQRKNSPTEMLIRLHERTGYGQAGFLNNLWAFIVDVFCVGMLAWIATGLYLWWKLPMTRGWGFAAIAGGVGTIGVLLASL